MAVDLGSLGDLVVRLHNQRSLALPSLCHLFDLVRYQFGGKIMALPRQLQVKLTFHRKTHNRH